MPDLHARLLAEIERREESLPAYVIGHHSWAEREAAYLAALRGVVDLHHAGRAGFTCITGAEFHCDEDGDCWPCSTMRSVARALGVEP